MTVALRIRMAPLLPWQEDPAEQRRFRGILSYSLALLLLLSILVPLLPLPDRAPAEPPRKPQLARLLLKPKPLPPPVVEKPKPKVERPKPVERPRPTVKKAAAPVTSKPVRQEPPPQTVDQARDRAKQAGLLAFRDELAAMRDQLDTSRLDSERLTRSRGAQADIQRRLVSANLSASSSGVAVAELSSDTSANALSGRETTRVESRGQGGADAGSGDGGVESTGQGRSDESVRRVFDRNKGAIFALYKRALRASPGLQGKVTVELQIEPSGLLSAVRLLSSELGDSALENKLLARIRMINFGAEDVATTLVSYTIDFMPY